MEFPHTDTTQPSSRPTASPVPSGARLIGDRYELRERIGAGAFSYTYTARDSKLGRTVALKMLRPEHAVDETDVSRFEREAQVAASVSHPNVVDIYDFGRHDETLYIVMQYVAGRDLKRLVEARGALPAEEAVQITRHVLAGLSAIHAAGIIHRDIKPQNVLMSDDGVARLTDFGVAHVAVDAGLTSAGTTVGTASYMAPEQARGGHLSEATDLYSVGVLLYELLTGRLPFDAPNPLAVMLAHIQQEPPPLHSGVADFAIPPALDQLVLRALAKEPEARFGSAREMAAALDSATGGGDGTTGQQTTTLLPTATGYGAAAPIGGTEVWAPPIAPAIAPDRRRRGWLVPLALLGLAALGIGGLMVFNVLAGNGGDADPPSSEATRIAAAVESEATETARAVWSLIDDEPTEEPAPTATEPDEIEQPAPPPVTPTPTASSTASPVPTATTPATATPTLVPTATATSTPTPSPPPPATETPAPVEEIGPTIAPSSGDIMTGDTTVSTGDSDGNAAAAAQPSTLQFAPGDWDAYYQVRGHGQPTINIYGAGSGEDNATLTFNLDQPPASAAVLTLVGSYSENFSNVPVQIAVNGNPVQVLESAFPSWNPNSTPSTQRPFSSYDIPFSPSLLQSGTNTITLTNLLDGPWSRPPYVLIAAATLTLDSGGGDG